MTSEHTTQYRAQLVEQGVPSQLAGRLGLAISRFETNQGRPDAITCQLITQYKAEICRANLWRFQLLSPTSRRRISPRGLLY